MTVGAKPPPGRPKVVTAPSGGREHTQCVTVGAYISLGLPLCLFTAIGATLVHACCRVLRQWRYLPQDYVVKPRLLIVDDSNVSRLMIRGRVAALQPDWEVIEAASGDEAVALVATVKPDFITMDVNMPGITGFEAAEKIRQTDQRVKIVILTANIQSSSREKAERLAAKFVQKPVTQASMQQAIDYFLATQ